MNAIKKRLHIIIISAIIVLMLVLGVLFNTHTKNKDKFRMLAKTYPTAQKIVEEENFLRNDRMVAYIDGARTEILKKYYVYEKNKEVGLIYLGITTGWNEDLVVGFGIKHETAEIVGMNLFANNETDMYVSALFGSEKYLSQFNEKSLDDEIFTVDTIAGVTPQGSKGVISPYTSEGIARVMTLARQQYEKDTDYKIPQFSKLLSKQQNLENINLFEYVIEYSKDGVKTEVTVVVNKDYEIQSVSVEEFDNDDDRAQLLNIIKRDKFKLMITAVEKSDTETTLTIATPGFAVTFDTIVKIDSNGKIILIEADLSKETYEYGSWKESNGHPNDIMVDKIIDDQSTDVDSIAGATVTSNALKQAVELAFKYIEEVIK